jgi:hypothetical protein
MVMLEGLGTLKINPLASSEIEPDTKMHFKVSGSLYNALNSHLYEDHEIFQV